MFMNPTAYDDTRPCWNPPLALENLGNIYACGRENEKKRSQKQKKEWMRYRQILIKTLCHEKNHLLPNSWHIQTETLHLEHFC